MTALLLLTCSALLTGCQATEDPTFIYKYVKDKPPRELMECNDAPAFAPRRLGHKPTQGDAAHYVVGLKVDLHTCHNNAEALKEWADGE